MVPRPVVGQRWSTGLALSLRDAVEVDSATCLAICNGVDPLRPTLPVYDVVGRIGPHPWSGWRVLDAGPVSFVARDGGRELPHGATVRALSPLLVDPDGWADEGLVVANPRGWRSWLVRHVLDARGSAAAGLVYVELEVAGRPKR